MSKPTKPHRPNLTLESLEDRLALSSAVGNGSLFMDGPPARDVVQVSKVDRTYTVLQGADMIGHVQLDQNRLITANPAPFAATAAWSWNDGGLALAPGAKPLILVRGNPRSNSTSAVLLNVFVRGSNGHLYERFWDGNSWSYWTDTGMAVTGNAVAVIRGDTGSLNSSAVRINLFVRGANGHLLERFWGGSTWTWRDTGKAITGSPVILSRGDTRAVDAGNQRIHVFVRGTDGHLWEHFWDGSSWNWTDTGGRVALGASPLILTRGNITLADASQLRINLFVRGANGHLLEYYWDGSSWNWSDTGRAVLGDAVAIQRGDTASTDAGEVRINLFVRGNNGHLLERYWDGASWSWSDTGRSVAGLPTILVRGDNGLTSASAVRINLFVRGANGHLLERYWDGSSWIWSDTGRSVLGDPVAIQRGSYFSTDASGVRINLFVRRSDGRLLERIWDGSTWTWRDTGRSATTDPVVLQRGNDFSTNMNDVLINLFVRGTNGHILERVWG